ncbi:MAG: arsenate reductase family protein [Oscillospiraceae bacterium]|nr:arsenate reductase family protein [Oscillospiraceae bacterium]
MVFLCYPKCSTCQKAQNWLQTQSVDFRLRNIKEENPTVEELRLWQQRSGQPLKKFFNTSGLLYKELKLKDRLPELSEEEQLALLSSNGMLVKRPLLITEDSVLIGFKEGQWAALLQK